jgi:hypothetical protein
VPGTSLADASSNRRWHNDNAKQERGYFRGFSADLAGGRDRIMQSLLNQQAQFVADSAKAQTRHDAESRLFAKTDRIADA